MFTSSDINSLSDVFSQASLECTQHSSVRFVDGLCPLQIRDTDPWKGGCMSLRLQLNLLYKLSAAPGMALRYRLYFSVAYLSVLLWCPVATVAMRMRLVSCVGLSHWLSSSVTCCIIRKLGNLVLPGLIVCLHALVEHDFRLCLNRTSLYVCSSYSCQLCQTWECWQFLVSSTVPHPVLLTSVSILVWSVWEGSEVISCHSSVLRLWAVRLKACQPNSYTISECVIEVCLSLCYHRDPILQSTESYSVHNMAFELAQNLQGPTFVSSSPLDHQRNWNQEH